MLSFKEFFNDLDDLFLSEYTDIHWSLFSNVPDLVPLHLIEDVESEDKNAKHPVYSAIAAGESNPKTAKDPKNKKFYIGSVLHLEPYMSSGGQTCPFATAIYKIQINAQKTNPEIVRNILSSPGSMSDGEFVTFYGFELRSKSDFEQLRSQKIVPPEERWGKLSDTLLPSKLKKTCPVRLKLRLPGQNLKDWNTGTTIELTRDEILWTRLVGGCANACLHTAGNPQYAMAKLKSRREKTNEFFENPNSFKAKILIDLFKLCSAAEDQQRKPVIRLNATSDIDWENERFPSNIEETKGILSQIAKLGRKFHDAVKKIVSSKADDWNALLEDVARFVSGKSLIEIFKNIQFYDYTKNPSRMAQFLRKKKDWPENYHLTFSLAEGNRDLAKRFLAEGGNVAVVFNVMKSASHADPLPKTWEGFKVIDADKHDYRFLDKPGCVSGLRAKGEAMFSSTDFGFVVQPDDPGLNQKEKAVHLMHIKSAERRKREEKGLVSKPGSKRAQMRAAGKKIGIPVYY